MLLQKKLRISDSVRDCNASSFQYPASGHKATDCVIVIFALQWCFCVSFVFRGRIGGQQGRRVGGSFKCLVVRLNPQAECTWSNWDKAKQIAPVSAFGQLLTSAVFDSLQITSVGVIKIATAVAAASFASSFVISFSSPSSPPPLFAQCYNIEDGCHPLHEASFNWMRPLSGGNKPSANYPLLSSFVWPPASV